MSFPRRRNAKNARQHDVTGRYLAGDFDEDGVEKDEKYNNRAKKAQQEKILRTAAMRAAADGATAGENIESLPLGQVIQVHSLFCEVIHEATTFLCVTRKTLTKVSDTAIVVGDHVRFRESGATDEQGRQEAVIEQVMPRRTVLTRADSFKRIEQHPIVANADQMLIIASLLQPRVKWGLIDRMLIAAQSGKLRPILCLNKLDLALAGGKQGIEALGEADAALEHYQSLGVQTLRTSVDDGKGLDELRIVLKDQSTVLAGHSGVGKSSLINAIQPTLDLRVGDVSEYTDKGRHTTTSARRYPLDFGGSVIDTPGVKLFGLWEVSRENLADFFPDVAAGSAPEWRIESCKRISDSLPD